jgi:NAD(P)H dehydrogenase (quinone)
MIAVTGATGALGGRVAARLAERSVRQRLIVRDPSRAPQFAGAEVCTASGYHDRAGMTAALGGADTLFFVSGRESSERLNEHRTVVDAALDAGVSRIVYLSFYNASPASTFTLAHDHHATEAFIRASGLAYTFLQDNFYADLMPLLASADGVIAGPGGTGAVACVARDDVAAVAAAVLPDPAFNGATLRMTGPAALSLAEIAAELGRVSRRIVTYKTETLEEAYASRAAYNAPKFEVDGWVSTYLAIATGELAAVSSDVPRVLGRAAMTLSDVLGKYPESYAHLIGA